MSQAPGKGSLLVVFLTIFVDLLGFGIVLPLLPIYGKQFALDPTGMTLGLLMASFSAMQFLFAPVWGRISDRIGRRPVLILGLIGSTLFYGMFALATVFASLTLLFVSRIGAGVCGATISTAQAYIADTTTHENRARGMALIGAAFGLGFTFGPLLAAASLWSAGEHATSPWPGVTASSLSAVALLLAIFKLPESLRPDSQRARHAWFDATSLRDALAVPTILALLAASFVSVLAFANFESILSLMLASPPAEGGFGFSLIRTLWIFALVGFFHAVGQGMVRGLSRRFSEGKLAIFGTLTSIAAFFLLVIAIGRLSIPTLLAATIIQATGFAFVPPALNSLISRRSDPSKQGGILGIGQSLGALARILGHGIGIPLFSLAATIPFFAGALLMLVTLGLLAISVFRGRDFRTGDDAAMESSG